MCKIILSAYLMLITGLSLSAQNKTSTSYWGQVPNFPTGTSLVEFRGFIEKCEDLQRSIDEEMQKQQEIVSKKMTSINYQNVPNPQNMTPAQAQAYMQGAQKTAQDMADMQQQYSTINSRRADVDTDYKTDLNKRIETKRESLLQKCPYGAESKQSVINACVKMHKDFEVVKDGFCNEYYISGQGVYKSYLGDFAALQKKNEALVLKMRNEALARTGINTTGLPCPETLKLVYEYLGEIVAIYKQAEGDQLLSY